MAEEQSRRRRRFGLVAGAVALAAGASLVTLAFVEVPGGTPVAGSLAAAVVPNGGGGKGTPTPTPTGKGKGVPGKGKGADPGTGASVVTTLANAERVAGFRVRTLDGLAGAQLQQVTIQSVRFDTAPGRPIETVVSLTYALGQTQITIDEVVNPLPGVAPGAIGQEVQVGGAPFALIPRTGLVTAATANDEDGVAVVVFFNAHTPAGVTGVDRQTAQQVIERLG